MEQRESLVIFGGVSPALLGARLVGQPVTVDGVPMRCGLVPTPAPAFDPDDPANAHRVVVRVTAMSCNYRDKSFIISVRNVPAHRFSPIGSEFAGEVVAVGRAVTGLRPGDRVIPDHAYTGRGMHPDGVPEGVVTNRSSRGWQVVHERKLARIPDGMRYEDAAAFSIGAQTAYSMVRKLDLRPGARALVTSGVSNTSLFLVAALRRAGVSVAASTTSPRFGPHLVRCGVDEVIVAERLPGGAGLRRAIRAAAGAGFDAILDPFFDLHVAAAVDALAPGGKYVTCGLAGQNEFSVASAGIDDVPAVPLLLKAMIKNLTLIGNCIGLTSDLELALGDYAEGRLVPVIDSVYSGRDAAAAFFDRTFNAPDRFGKVVFRYRDN